MKTITLKQDGFIIKGVADLTLWGGGQGSIDMKSFKVQSLKDIKKNLNDNGFGVQSINGAVVQIYENYEGHEVFLKDKVIGKVSDSTFNYINESFI
jgi:hypothetical protein